MISFVPGYYGFLGNQMFQYAATKALALKHGTECVWPGGKHPELHKVFNLRAFKEPHPGDRTTHRYQEKHFHFDPEFWNLPDGTQLSGYFQSERYFADCGEIRGEFNFHLRNPWGYEPGRGPWVSIHVRRGDYLSFPEHHPPLTMDYYREAMAHFPGERFVIFTDDPGWCLLNFDRERCEISVGRSPTEDMALMGSGAHHIIANSSFSWWSAWLNPNPDKKVIAPAKWFGPAKAGWSTKDLIPEGWVRL